MAFWTKQVEWSEAVVGTYTDLGELHTDSSHSPEPATEETSAGNELYGGTDDAYAIPAYDMTKYEALRVIQLADGKVDLRFTDAENNAEVESGFSVVVTKNKTFSPRQRAVFTARFRRSFL